MQSCRHCKKKLTNEQQVATYCEYCGGKLQDDEDLSSCLITIDNVTDTESRRPSFINHSLEWIDVNTNVCHICDKPKEMYCNWKQLCNKGCGRGMCADCSIKQPWTVLLGKNPSEKNCCKDCEHNRHNSQLMYDALIIGGYVLFAAVIASMIVIVDQLLSA